jgi:hypothetical protein
MREYPEKDFNSKEVPHVWEACMLPAAVLANLL